jgi:hypothetical protein
MPHHESTENGMPRAAVALGGVAVALAALAPQPVSSQDWTRREFPLAPPNSKGNFVAPYFDGYYPNEDGTYTISFGFMNRNDEDLIEIPLGPDNFIEPAEFDGVQPTSFPVVSYPGFGGPRERGAFGVVVPGDFEGDVWWTLTTDGYTTRVPGRLYSPGLVIKGAYELSTTPMAAGSLRPTIRFTEGGADDWGIEGIEHPETFATRVGEPIEVRFWAFDRGERELGAVNMSLWKQQGPVGGKISFESLVEAPSGAAAASGLNLPPGVTLDDIPPEVRARFGLGAGGGRAPGPGPIDVGAPVRLPTEGANANMGRFRATFHMPGDYLIRVRIDNFNAAGDSSVGNQCCWSNGYVRVSVTD